MIYKPIIGVKIHVSWVAWKGIQAKVLSHLSRFDMSRLNQNLNCAFLNSSTSSYRQHPFTYKKFYLLTEKSFRQTPTGTKRPQFPIQSTGIRRRPLPWFPSNGRRTQGLATWFRRMLPDGYALLEAARRIGAFARFRLVSARSLPRLVH